MKKFGAFILGFLVFAFVAWILPPLLKIIMALIVIAFSLSPNPRVANVFEVTISFAAILIPALISRKVYRVIVKSEVTHKSFRLSRM